MKPGIHPEYGDVAFRDRSTGEVMITRSTLVAQQGRQQGKQGKQQGKAEARTIEVGGVAYPLIDVDISNRSHPFWTGTARKVDTEGRLAKFERRYGGRK